MPDKVGQQIGNYRLVRLLGSGGFAEVYLGQHVHLASKQAAVKMLQLFDVDVEKFQEEAETTEKLVHPHIIRLLDFALQEGTPFLVLDYAPGGSLRARYPRGSQLPLDIVVGYLKQITPALQYAHDRGILHRDIKPENILIGRQGELLLSDFGIAVLSQTGRTTLQNYAVGGTPFYMAPEQYRGKPEKASDQYALAVVVYEWLCGTVPFREGNFIQLGYQHTHEPVPPMREKIPSIPSAVEEVVMTALAKDPIQRFGSMRAFANAFEQACLPTLQAVSPVESLPIQSTPTETPTIQATPQEVVVSQQSEQGVGVSEGEPVSEEIASIPLTELPVPTVPASQQSLQSVPDATAPQSSYGSPPYQSPYEPYNVAPPPPSPQRPRNRIGIIVGVVLLVLLLIGGGVFAWLQYFAALQNFTAKGTATILSSTTTSVRQDSNNKIYSFTQQAVSYGDITGSFTSEETSIVHPDTTASFSGSSICNCTVAGKSGTLMWSFTGTSTANGSFQGQFFDIHGTGDLAKLHGQGEFQGQGDHETYSSELHFDA